MDQKEEVERTVKRGSRTGSRSNPYTYDEKLRAVKLFVEEGFNGELVCTETGVSQSSLAKWTKSYREQGRWGCGEATPRSGRRPPRSGKSEDRGSWSGETRSSGLNASRTACGAGSSLKRARPGSERPSTRRALMDERVKASPHGAAARTLSGRRRTRCGRAISLPSSWEGNTPYAVALPG